MLSRIFLIKQRACCGNGCLMCPYNEKHKKGSKIICKDVADSLEEWEKKEILRSKIKIRSSDE
tara:strand:- start:9 stop:197 length:189 start_codon:yes stop_codon:yes gene_type:complete